MTRNRSAVGIVVAAVLAGVEFQSHVALQTEPDSVSPVRAYKARLYDRTPAKEATSLDDLFSGRAKVVDLTYTINDKTPFWPGPKYEPFRLKTIATLEKDGVLSKVFSMPEHLGTHIDAPNHFAKKQPSVDQIRTADLFAPGVMIDITTKCEQNADTMLTLADIRAWEKKHGPIPAGAIVFLKTGWARHWRNVARFQNRDVRGKLHFPGFSPESARFLIGRRKVKAIGIDTLSIDRGLSSDFQVHHIVNGAGRYALENVANLKLLPARGFYVIVAPIKIETGSGGPARIFAVLTGK